MIIRNMFYESVILKDALSHPTYEYAGSQTTVPHLMRAATAFGLDPSETQLKNAMIRLRERGAIQLRKYRVHAPPSLGYDVMDYSEYTNRDEFFWVQFGVIVDPRHR
jgi:hypothetical protein